MNEQHFSLASRPFWDEQTDMHYIDCSCGERIWSNSAVGAQTEYRTHKEDSE